MTVDSHPGIIKPSIIDNSNGSFISILFILFLFRISTSPASDKILLLSMIGCSLEKTDIIVSRLARGVPVGASFDYVDELTLTHSLKDRVKYK